MIEYHKKQPMRIEEVTSGSSLTGIEPSAVASVIAVITIALNQAEKFVPGIVQIDENEQIDGSHYLRNPFHSAPSWGVSSISYNTRDLLVLAGGNQ